jgi:hypothetical protein
VQSNQQTEQDNNAAQCMGNFVRAITQLPRVMCGNVLAFLVHEGAIFGRWVSIVKAHKRAVGYQRNDAVCFVIRKLQTTNPREYDDQPDPEHRHTNTVNGGSPFIEAQQQ